MNTAAVSSCAVVICLLYACVVDPRGAINVFMCHLIEVIFSQLPSTPPQYQLANILIQFSNQNTFIGWGVLWEIIQLPIGLLSLFLIYKLVIFIKP